MSSPSNPDHLEQLVYVSDDANGISSVLRAEDILVVARHNNARDAITGALAITAGRFVQVLEGHPMRLDDLLRRLEVDHRHTNLIVLARRRINDRDFLDWDMVSPRLVREELSILQALLADHGASIDAYVGVLAQAVSRQSDTLKAYGFMTSSSVDGGSSPQS